MKQIIIPFAAALTFALWAAAPGLAQATDSSELSAEEIAEIFARQKTRGLVLAPSTGLPGEPVEDSSVVAPSAAAATYVKLESEDQVNIQISFDFDSSALRNDQKPKLASLCQVLTAPESGEFRIVGHTDSSGSARYNERLSLLRAQEVKRYLVSDCGVVAEKLHAVGVGESFPLDAADPRADRNRRVEFQAMS